MDKMFDTMEAAALAGICFISVPGKGHVNTSELIRGRRVNGEEAVTAESAEIVQSALTGKTHYKISGGDVALEADELDAAPPEGGKREANLIDERSVVAVERGLHALDRAGG